MNGQWIGEYNGTNNGSIIVNVDDRGDHFEGVAYLLQSNSSLPSSAASFTTKDKSNEFEFKTQVIMPIHPSTRVPDTWDNLKGFYPDASISKDACVRGSWDKEKLILKWETDIGVEGECRLPKSKAEQKSEYQPIEDITNWDDYKNHVMSWENRSLFRGQNKQKRLRTAFHKTGRANLIRFMQKDIPALYQHLSSRTRHVFNLDNPDENGAFYNLVQHHGYPTPLLDWSFSPYVAAFFAYRDITKLKALQAEEDEKVRIFVFDQQQWENDDLFKSRHLQVSWPYLTIIESIALENERVLPQQAVSTLTNVDDIESFIKINGMSQVKVAFFS